MGMPVTKAKKTAVIISPRIMELRKKINDSSYVDNAIDRIAIIMSRHIVEENCSANPASDVLVG